LAAQPKPLLTPRIIMKAKIYKELDYVYIVNGKKFVCKKKAEKYARTLDAK